MTGPRTKRQFAGAASDPSQRQITSFFTKTSSSTGCSAAAPASSKPTGFNGPALPAQVQTDLLTVGMRVRKAVPEGYKTGSAYCAFQLWSEDSNGNNSSTTSSSFSRPAAAPSSFSSSLRELEPFCGINKVGGMAFQPSHNSGTGQGHHLTDSESDDMDAMPGLTSSQDSVSSTGSIPSSAAGRLNMAAVAAAVSASPPPRKRFFVAEDEEERDALSVPHPHGGPFRLSSHDAWLDAEISPRSLAPPAGWENARVLAVPRRSRQSKAAKSGLSAAAGNTDAEVALVGQENVMVVVQDGNDFEEASFLDHRLAGDMDVE
ncbi:hypothetical protein VTK56DRAFT_9485 [Thermocarpiscus australiensis]